MSETQSAGLVFRLLCRLVIHLPRYWRFAAVQPDARQYQNVASKLARFVGRARGHLDFTVRLSRLPVPPGRSAVLFPRDRIFSHSRQHFCTAQRPTVRAAHSSLFDCGVLSCVLWVAQHRGDGDAWLGQWSDD